VGVKGWGWMLLHMYMHNRPATFHLHYQCMYRCGEYSIVAIRAVTVGNRFACQSVYNFESIVTWAKCSCTDISFYTQCAHNK